MFKQIVFLVFVFLIGLPFAQADLDTIFFDDFESGDLSAWQPYISIAQWHRSTTGAYSGKSWWCGNETLGGYSNCWYQILTSPEISLPPTPAGTLRLTFMLSMRVEAPPTYPTDVGGTIVDGWDGFHIVISSDDGANWQILFPTDGYNCDTMYGFLFNNDSLFSGWGGATSGWENKEFLLDAYAGENVLIRFVFAADPFTSTHNDADLFGVRIDNISVLDDEEVFFYDDAEDTITTHFTSSDAEPHPLPAVNSAVSYSGEYSMFAQNIHITNYSIVSPAINIPDSFLATGSYRTFRDMPDDDDYYVIYISTDDGICWIPIADDNHWDTDWELVAGSSGLGDAYPGLLLYDAMGMSIMLRLTFIFDRDDIPDAGDGVYIDDFCISGIIGNTFDAGVTNIFTGPINLNQDIIFTAEVTGFGIETIEPAVYYKIFDDEGTLITPGFLGSASVRLNEKRYLQFIWRPTEPGEYHILSWTTDVSDENGSNDTLVYDFTVPDENYRQLGYDDAVQDSFLSPSTGEYHYYIVPGIDDFSEVGDGYGVDFSSPFDIVHLSQISVLGRGEGNITFAVFELTDGTPATTPDTTFSAELPAGGIDGEWFSYTLSDDYVIPSHDFIIAVFASDTESFFWVGIDNTPPHDHRSWRIDPEAEGYTFQQMTELSPPYNDFDFIIRCNVWNEGSIKNASMPNELSLVRNFPNPFNSATSISFTLPDDGDVSLVIYDIRGDEVRNLLHSKMSKGTHTIMWNGKDDDNTSVPSGTYLLKVQYEDKLQVKKMALVR